jgi:hypothetical protein
LLREPLTHFLIGGLVLFLLVEVLASDQAGSNDPRELVVDQTVLENYLQVQSRGVDVAVGQEARLQALPPEDREQLIADYVSDEVLYREALAFGLDENDEVIRRRLIQKLDFVTRSLLANTTGISEAELQEYYAAHRDDYRIDPAVTLTHVFFDARRHGADRALLLAEETLGRLNNKRVPFDLASRYGDRFHFHRNYVDRTPAYVASHFGPPMAAQVFRLAPSATLWRGPFVSPYGAHLVLVTRISPARVPELEEVATLVWEDAQRAKLEDARKAVHEEWISRYRIRRELSDESRER